MRKEKKMKKKISAAIKLKVAIEALKGEMTIGEIASRYEVSPAEVRLCKKRLEETGKSVFKRKGKRGDLGHKEELEKAHASIGRLMVENDCRKRFFITCARTSS